MTSQQTAQTAQTAELDTLSVIDRFNKAFNEHDAESLATLLTDNTVFEDTSPPPDGRRIEGKVAAVAFWREWFARNPDANFEAEETIVSGDRAVVRWVYRERTGHTVTVVRGKGKDAERPTLPSSWRGRFHCTTRQSGREACLR